VVGQRDGRPQQELAARGRAPGRARRLTRLDSLAPRPVAEGPS
jgi:hypothetical protein